jgi:hypothetical protein
MNNKKFPVTKRKTDEGEGRLKAGDLKPPTLATTQ